MKKHNTAIFVVTHTAPTLKLLEGYYYIGVGKEKHKYVFPYYDDVGDNIFAKNQTYCELTALYWIWKNYDKSKFMGLVHYRRFFYHPYLGLNSYKIYNIYEIDRLLKRYDILLPKKQFLSQNRQMNVYEHYKKFHFIQDLALTRDAVKKLHPDYISDFDWVMKQKEMYLYNILVCSPKLLDQYCSFLFSVLFEVEKKIDYSSYDNYQKRVFGFLSERLLNVFVHHNKAMKVKELPTCNLSISKQEAIRRKFKTLKGRIFKNDFYNLCI